MLRKTNDRGFVVIIAIVVVIIAVALIIVITNRGDDATEPVTGPVTGQPEQPPTGPITEPGPEQPPAPGPEQPPLPETPTPQPGPLPANWDELSSAEKIALNPLGCDITTQTIWASDGSCHDKSANSRDSLLLHVGYIGSGGADRSLICLRGQDICGWDASVQLKEAVSTTNYRAELLNVRPSRSNENENCVWTLSGLFRLTTESGRTYQSNAQPLRTTCSHDLDVDDYSSLYIAFDIPEADYPTDDGSIQVSLESDWASFAPEFSKGFSVDINRPIYGQPPVQPTSFPPGAPAPFQITQLDRATLTCYHVTSLPNQCNLGGVAFIPTDNITIGNHPKEHMSYQDSNDRGRNCIEVRAGFFGLTLGDGRTFDSQPRSIPKCHYENKGFGSAWYVRFEIPMSEYPDEGSTVTFESIGSISPSVQTSAPVDHHYYPSRSAPLSYVNGSFKASCDPGEASFCRVDFEVVLLEDIDIEQARAKPYTLHDSMRLRSDEQCLRVQALDFITLSTGGADEVLFACHNTGLPDTLSKGNRYRVSSVTGALGDSISVELKTTPAVTLDNIKVGQSRQY